MVPDDIRKGERLTLRQARDEGRLDQFIAENPHDGDESGLDDILVSLIKSPGLADPSSSEADAEG